MWRPHDHRDRTPARALLFAAAVEWGLAARAARRDLSDEKMTIAAAKTPPVRTERGAPADDRNFDHLHARGRAGLWAFFVAVTVLTIQDFRLPNGGPVSLHLVRLVEFLLIGAGAEVNRRRPPPRPAIAVGVALVSGIYVTSAISGYLRNDAQTQLVTDLAIAFATATTMPWGPWWQLITLLAAGLSAAVAWLLVYGTFGNVSVHLLTGIAIAYLVSIYIAYQLQHYRAERDDAEGALRASEERFRALIERGSDTITIVDAVGGILYESPSIERVLGYRPEELIGRPVLDYIHPDDVARVRSLVLGARETASMECRSRRKDGTWCDIEAVARNLLDYPAVRGIVINWRDVGERKRAEHERRDPVAHARLHRHDRHGARHEPRAGSPGVSRARTFRRRGTPRHHQRHPRSLEDRGRQARDRARPAGCRRNDPRDRPPARALRRREGSRARLPCRCGPAPLARR